MIPTSMHMIASALASTWTYWAWERAGDNSPCVVIATTAEQAAEYEANGWKKLTAWDAAQYIVNV